MTSLTYGVLPTRETFDAGFEVECPDGYRIVLGRSDSASCEGFRLGDGTWSADELWSAIQEIVDSEVDEGYDARMDLVSAIMGTLGFEWI